MMLLRNDVSLREMMFAAQMKEPGNFRSEIAGSFL